jgi:PAS domain S-box-containing protein
MNLDPQFLKQFIENSIEGIWVINENNKTIYVNKIIANMLGYPPENFLGKEISDFMKKNEALELNKKIASRKDGVSEQHEARFISSSGTSIWISAFCNPIYDVNGKYIGSIGLISDINEQRRNEIILAAQKNVFEILLKGGTLKEALNQLLLSIEILVEGVLASILLLDEDGERLLSGASLHLPEDFNRSINGSHIGPDAGSCGTAAYLDELIITPDIDHDPLWKDYKHLADKHGLKACWSNPIQAGDGSVLGTFAMYFKEVRQPTAFELNLVKSVTSAAALSIEHTKLYERVKKHNDYMNLIAEARLILAHTIEYEEVLKDIPALIVSKGFADWAFICLKSDDGIFRSNTVAARKDLEEKVKSVQNLEFDLSSDLAISKAIKENISFYEDYDQESLLKILQITGPGGPNPKYIKVLQDLDLKSYGVAPLVVRNEVIGGLMVSSNRPDFKYRTSELNVIIEIARSCASAIDNASLYRESKNSIQAREDFISIASHELRTPLTSLKMRIDLLSMMIEKANFPPEVMEKIAPVVSEIRPDIQKFSKLIETLLDISKLDEKHISLSPSTCNLSKIIKDEISRLQDEFESSQTPLMAEVSDNVIGFCDQVRIEQVISNLLLNALKFGNRRPVQLRAHARDNVLTIEVKDKGIGISEKDQERIFKPFERAVSEKHFGGLGLGLYITKQIVAGHRGSIDVQSSQGDGTTFIVKLPLSCS